MAAAAAAKVVHRCDAAKETGKLDVSECQLMHVPDALYMLLMASPPSSCDLSKNELKKIPVKLCAKFSTLTELDARENQLTALPDDLQRLSLLRRLDAGQNQIRHVSPGVYQLAALEELNLDNNCLQEIDVDELMKMPALKSLSLRENPLNPNVVNRLKDSTTFTVQL